ncbi:hypothetical protein [Devosia aquimaris]|uniref:hypothetical protein n=1 Tax=Devosia aquimaris TaxID=2866214 RepID=UPI001CD0B1E6|nr:hypothetical protein [Devosia sp. CJK-A8-3]
MADSYYVNNTAQPNGDHEVHKAGCYWLSQARDTTYLGEFSHCRDAIAAAKRRHRQSNGCATCAYECHTG